MKLKARKTYKPQQSINHLEQGMEKSTLIQQDYHDLNTHANAHIYSSTYTQPPPPGGGWGGGGRLSDFWIGYSSFFALFAKFTFFNAMCMLSVTGKNKNNKAATLPSRLKTDVISSPETILFLITTG